MAIEDHYKTIFNISMRSKQKVNGRYTTSFISDTTDYLGAIFTPTTQREIRVGSEDYLIQKNLYCSSSIPLQHGDYITIDGGEYEIGNIKNTNNLNHHYQIGLISRIK